MEAYNDISTPAAGVKLADSDLNLLEEGGLQILSALMSHPGSVRQLSVQLGLSRTRVKFIIDKLLQGKMISIHQEITEEGRLEIYYTATVEDVSLQLNAQAPQHLRIRGAQLIIHSLQSNVLAALNDTERAQVLALKLAQCQIPGEQAREFVSKLEALVEEFTSAEDTSVQEIFALAFVLYPVKYQIG